MARSDVFPRAIWCFLPRSFFFRRFSLTRIIILLSLSLIAMLYLKSYYQLTDLANETRDFPDQGDSSSNSVLSRPLTDVFGASLHAFPATPVSSKTQKCVLPPLQLDDPLMISFVKKLPPITCPFPTPEWVHVQNGTLVFSRDAVAKVGKFTCDVSPLVRIAGNDNRFRWGTKIVNFSSGSQLTSDFNKVECRTLVRPTIPEPKIGPKRPPPPYYDYTDILMGVSPLNQAVWKRLKETAPPANGLSGLSVLMMGFDSMSRMSWLRRMKSTQEYLVNRLGGITLEGYNIMGDGTPAALFPILTGHHEEELPESRRNYRGARPVDGHPWIWKDFSEVGYVTSWADSEPGIAPFNFRLLGFQNPPTDYYARPYFLASRKNAFSSSEDTPCRSSTPSHQDWFNWVHDIFRMYRDHPKFMMHFYASLSHMDNNKITAADEDFKTLLQDLETQGYLNSTILVVFGDHGARYDHLRATWAGKLEERLPYMTFRFPPWFERKYPQLIRNFRTNAHRLTTAMDIHETLHDVIKFDGAGKGDISNRGISLFKEIPIERECKHADIRNHWCACLDWQQIKNPQTDAGAQRALQTAVGFINNLTEPHRELCAYLEIQSVTSGQSLQAQEDFMKFSRSSDIHGRIKILEEETKSNMKESQVLYQMTFMTKPGNALFEVTVSQKGKDSWKTSERDISRINKYGDAPFCILNINRQLRQYCYCNALVEK